jgi:flagellar biosynthesis protein FlhF
MRLKSFYAKTMTEAMQMVRDTLGEDAVIVATQEQAGGKSVHVTAAIDPSSYDNSFELGRDQDTGGYAAAPKADWLQYDEEQDTSAVEEEITDALLRHSVPEDVMDHILSCATVIGLDNSGISLIAAIEHLFNFRPLVNAPKNKPLMMIGPPGSGKTLMTAKIATRGVMDDLSVGVISTDTMRAGGIEQLMAFTSVLGTDLVQCTDPADLPYILEDMQGYDQIVIDTAGLNPFDKDDIRSMAKMIGSADLHPYLVLAAGADSEESGEIARACATIGANGLIPTRIDIARRMGGVLAAAHTGGLTFADLSATPQVADGLNEITPQSLANLLMPTGFSQAKSSPAKSALANKKRAV